MCLLLAGTMALVSSCQDYEPFSDETLHDKAYTHEFVKQFGEIDPDQDWDLFGQLARHIGPVTRANSEQLPQVNLLNGTDKQIQITRAKHGVYTTVLPELNIYNNSHEGSNLGQVTQDFLTTARKFTLSPVHWTTSSINEIGIYWYVDEEDDTTTPVMGKDGKLYYIKHFTIIDNHKTRLDIMKNGSLQSIDGCHSVTDQFSSDNDYLISHPIEVIVPNNITEYGFYIHNKGGGGQSDAGTRYSEWNLNPIASGRIEGDKINGGMTLEELKESKKTISYTATFNPSQLIRQDGTPVDPNDNHQYLCFEDWFNEGDADLNDVVYYAEGLDETNIVDKSAINENAILVCEDLKMYDFDFNDIVLGLNFKEDVEKKYKYEEEKEIEIDGHKVVIPAHWEAKETNVLGRTLYITPMAAGGAFETNVTFWGISRGEIHSLLKENPVLPSGSKEHQIINAGAEYEERADVIPITLESYQWNVGEGQGQYATYLSQLFAEGFFQLACFDGEAKVIIKNRPSEDSTNGSSSGSGIHYEEGYAPQMMLLPYYFEWPREQQHISLAYTGFSDWVSDITKTSWIFDSQVQELITERGNFLPDVDPSEGESTGQLVTGTELPHNNDNQFVYHDYDQNGNPRTTTYNNGEWIDLSGIAEITNEQSRAEITVEYSFKPSGPVYIDDANGNLLVWENGGTGGTTTTTYTFSANKFNQAIASGGIWILPGYVNNQEQWLAVSRVTIKIIGATEEYDPQQTNRHELTVTPASLTFNGPGETANITASSSTGATEFTYSSTNTKIATVNENGEVTAVAAGNTVIVVTAKASGSYASTVKRINVSVGRKTITLNGSSASAESVEGDEWQYNPSWTVDNPQGYVSGNTYTTYDRIMHFTSNISEDLSKWGNGGTLTFKYNITSGDFSPNIFRIKNPNGDVIAGDFTNFNQSLEGNVTFSLSSDDIASCLNNGQYTIIIEYRSITTISDTKLTSD